MFEAIHLLKSRLPIDRKLEVIHGDYIWTARFDWQTPLEDAIPNYLLIKPLPKDFLDFLIQVSNGCTLYYDAIYGQWGYKIYRAEEIESKQELWKFSLGEKWQDSFVAFAELYGEANTLLFDINLPTADSLSFAIREGSPIDSADNWPILSRSFHEWLDHLLTAQGAKYWEWK